MDKDPTFGACSLYLQIAIWKMEIWGISPPEVPFSRWAGSFPRMDYCNGRWLIGLLGYWETPLLELKKL